MRLEGGALRTRIQPIRDKKKRARDFFIPDYIKVIRYEAYYMTHHSGLFNSGSAPHLAIFE